MSYAPELTEPALGDLRQLEFWLQEETLDEIERAAANPLTLRMRSEAAVLDFVRRRGNAVFYVFVTLLPDESLHVLRVKRIGLYVRIDP